MGGREHAFFAWGLRVLGDSTCAPCLNPGSLFADRAEDYYFRSCQVGYAHFAEYALEISMNPVRRSVSAS